MSGRKETNQTRDIGAEKVLYRVGLVAAFVAATGFLVYRFGPQQLRDFAHQYSFCVIYRFTGFYCPGCGGSRAVAELLRGNIVASFLYHPLAAYGIILYLVFMGSHTAAYLVSWLRRAADRRRTGRRDSAPGRNGQGKGNEKENEERLYTLHGIRWRTSYLTVAVILLIGNFAVKNIIRLATGVDILARLDQIFLR